MPSNSGTRLDGAIHLVLMALQTVTVYHAHSSELAEGNAWKSSHLEVLVPVFSSRCLVRVRRI